MSFNDKENAPISRPVGFKSLEQIISEVHKESQLFQVPHNINYLELKNEACIDY